jgi:pimeloyl-ACP methyl ester carboxylesterase
MQPADDLSLDAFNDWYNNEHGPNRLRLPFILNGLRYRAIDGLKPEWMAIYDTPDLENFTLPSYTKLRSRSEQSQREIEIMPKISISRGFYCLEEEESRKNFVRPENIEEIGTSHILVAAKVTLNGKTHQSQYEEWFDKEHIPLLSKVPGWRRSRRLSYSVLNENHDSVTEVLGLHGYDSTAGLESEEFQSATNTAWRQEVFRTAVKEKHRRVYELHYVFGPAPRDVASPKSDMNYPDGLTKIVPGPKNTTIDSYVMINGTSIKYRLEGKPNGTTMVLVNSILVNWGIWDTFVSTLYGRSSGFQILRYNTRGRDGEVGEKSVTVNTLADDVICLLDSLRISKAVVIGVSLGGATALNLALRHPSRVHSFVSCDTNSFAPPTNAKAWQDRIDVAERESMRDEKGNLIVGMDLAEMTTRRWFTAKSCEDSGKAEDIDRVKEMVKTNSLEGFKKSVRALYEYDFRQEMGKGTVHGMFLVGANDGILPQTMKTMAESYATGRSPCMVIPDAGHLPMVENPEAFTDAVLKFLINN